MKIKKLEYLYTDTDWRTINELEKKLPKGCRWAEGWELLRDYLDDVVMKKYLKDDWLVCMTANGLRAAWLGCDGNYFSINTGNDLYSDYAARGVYVKKEV